MRSLVRHIVPGVAGLLLIPQLAAQNCVCSGFNSQRTDAGYSFTEGIYFSRARANLTDPVYFGSAGVVNRSIVIGAGTGIASDSTLGGVNIFFTGLTGIGSFTSQERTAIATAVNNGMNVVLTTEDAAHDISDLFGATLASATSTISVATSPEHPIFAGPFGRVSQFRGAGTTGRFRGWSSSTQVLASNSDGPTMLLIPRATLAPAAGGVVLISDIDLLTTFDRILEANSSEPSLPVTDALVMNLVAFLCNPTALAIAPHLVFPQFANGGDSGGKNLSELVITNTDNQNPVSATVTLRDDNGSPFFVNLAEMGSVSTFVTGNIQPNFTQIYNTDGVGTLKSGWVSIRGSSALTGNVIFNLPGYGITGVPASEMAGGFDLPVVPVPSATSTLGVVDVFTGLAVSNLTAKTATVRMELWDSTGRRSDGVTTTTVPAYGHIAKFLFQLYPTFDFNGFRGTLRIVSTNALLAVTALQLGSGAGQFAALPVKALFR